MTLLMLFIFAWLFLLTAVCFIPPHGRGRPARNTANHFFNLNQGVTDKVSLTVPNYADMKSAGHRRRDHRNMCIFSLAAGGIAA